MKELHPHLGSQLAAGSQPERRGREWGAASCQVSPVLFQNLPETCQTGLSWLLGPFGQVMTFWTLVPLYVESREHSVSLSVQENSFIEHWLSYVIPGAGESVVDKQHSSSRRVSQERGDRKCNRPRGSVSSGVCGAAVTGWCSACQLPASCPPFCVLQVLEACNYISQAPVRFWEWREPVRGGEAQGREKQHFLLSQMTSRVAAAEWHWAWALLQPQSMNLPNLHWKCYEYLKEVFGRLLITFIRLPKKYGILKIIRKWRQGCLSITYIPSGSGTSLSPRWDSGRNIYLFLLLFILDLFIFTLCLTFSLWSIFIMYITY